jgi:hypothetical protein
MFNSAEESHPGRPGASRRRRLVITLAVLLPDRRPWYRIPGATPPVRWQPPGVRCLGSRLHRLPPVNRPT